MWIPPRVKAQGDAGGQQGADENERLPNIRYFASEGLVLPSEAVALKAKSGL